jgi:hypothetical protein
MIAAKGLIFTAILIARWQVLRRYYPGAKMQSVSDAYHLSYKPMEARP